MSTWFQSRNLLISAPKSSATLFTTFSNEMSMDLPIYIDGAKVPTKKDPKVLGVTFDPLLTFKTHSADLKKKLLSRNNILKALAGSSWGKEKETLLTTFKATSQSLLNYCSPIWTPTLSETNWKELQVGQSASLRTALGCVKMASNDHLHSEAKVMPVRDHCEMLSTQFLLATTQPNHPNLPDLNLKPPRNMKDTLVSKFSNHIRDMVPDGGTDLPTYRSGLKRLHTSFVSSTISNQSNNRVLNEPAPPIDSSEKELTRSTRVT